MTDHIKPWSENRSDTPVVLPEDAGNKNVRLLNPLGAPDLYYELYDNAASKVTINDPAFKEPSNYELVRNINDPDSGFHAKVIRNPETDHYALLLKGMDMPLRDEGAGRFGFDRDLGDLDRAQSYGCLTDQVLQAEQAYLELLADPNVKSIEVIGYSIGSIPANYLASVYDAKVTNIADLGTPNSGWDARIQGFLSSNFEVCAHGLFPGAHGAFKEQLDANVVGLELRLDAMGGVLGGVGPRHGERIVLDENGMNPFGVAHVPDVYAATAREEHNAPETQTVEKLKVDTWKPF